VKTAFYIPFKNKKTFFEDVDTSHHTWYYAIGAFVYRFLF